MNVFRLAPTPERAARMHCDQHTTKMCLESGQLLCTALHQAGYSEPERLYDPTHEHHPLVGWVAEARHNYQWVYDLCRALAREKRIRYGGRHATWGLVKTLPDAPDCIPAGATPQPLCMPDEIADDDAPVLSYRRFYRADKDFATWDKGRAPPSWW